MRSSIPVERDSIPQREGRGLMLRCPFGRNTFFSSFFRLFGAFHRWSDLILWPYWLMRHARLSYSLCFSFHLFKRPRPIRPNPLSKLNAEVFAAFIRPSFPVIILANILRSSRKVSDSDSSFLHYAFPFACSALPILSAALPFGVAPGYRRNPSFASPDERG